MCINKLNRLSIVVLLVGIVFICQNCKQQAYLKPGNMKCEYMKKPMGIDISEPRFSWNIESTSRGISQKAYRILVADSREALGNNSGNIWDSKKKESGNSINISFKGKPLQSSQQYFWKVQVWDQNGNASEWSEPSVFYTGILPQKKWEAQWIAAADTTLAAPLLRKVFNIEGNIKEAIVHVTGLGYYELYLNGQKAGDHVLDPAITNYKERVLYSTYDVTDFLNKGNNVAGIMLGNGAYRLIKEEGRFSWWGQKNLFGPLCCIMQLEVKLADGSHKTVVSDGSWLSSSGPVIANQFYGGEDFDARLEKKGWATVDHNTDKWDNVRIVEGPKGKLDAQLMCPMKITETIAPVAETNPEPGVYLYDFGQNFPGWWHLTVQGEAGTKVRIRGAETLNDSLFPQPLDAEDHISTKHPYHANVFTTYILKGEGTETYHPRFFYTGFRYIEVQVEDPQKIKSLDVRGQVVHSGLQRNGSFTTSDALVNDIHKASIWSQRGNLHGYPTDCPQREKGAYTGDGQVIAEASIHDFHMAALYTKWLNDMKDCQEESGRIPNTAPEMVGGSGGGIAWGSAYILLPWWMYQYYDDERVLDAHYPYMKKYLGYLHELARTDSVPAEKYIINEFGTYWLSLGEWCAPGQSDGPNHPVVNTAYYYKDAMTLAKIASALGKEKDAERYEKLADTIAKAYNEKFLDPDTYLYGTEDVYQTYQVLALAFDIVPEDMRGQVLQTIVDDIEKRDGHLNTGILGTKHLWPVLVTNGHAELAYKIATQTTYPSYGYWLENGATTLWEKWSGKASHNHQMFGSVDELFFKYLAGIRAPGKEGTSKGYKHVLIKPFIPDGLTSVNASVETAAGTIKSNWENQNETLTMNVSIPANSTGDICIPVSASENVQVEESGEIIWKDGAFTASVEGIRGGEKTDDGISFSVASGSYRFVVK